MTTISREKLQILKKDFQPDAIFLFGSRAGKYYTPKSDWDILILTNAKLSGRSFILDNERFDVDVYPSNVSIKKLLSDYGGALQNIKLVFSKYKKYSLIEKKLKKIYNTGRNLTSQEIRLRKEFLQRRLEKLEANVNDQILFNFHLGVFLDRALRYWFELGKNQWAQSPGTALRIIKKEDIVYYRLLKKITALIKPQQRIQAAKYLATKIDRLS